MSLLVFVAAAHAASVTDVPPFLRGDAWVRYSYDRLAGGLTEVDYQEDPARVPVGTRRIETHQLHYGFAFAAGPGVAVFLDIPHDVSSMVTFDSWHEMVYKPSTGSGTYTSSAEEPPFTVADGTGIHGAWIGLKGTPFSSQFKTRPSEATWLLSGAIRTPNAENNYWTVVEPAAKKVGMRGAGPGGLGLRFETAFSTRLGAGEPYITAAYQYEAPVKVDLVNDQGESLAPNQKLNPPDSFQVRFGSEITLGENTTSGSRTNLDLHANFNYTTWGTVPTGVYLAGVLIDDAGKVQTAESLEPGAGLALGIRPFQYLQVDLKVDGYYHFPQRIEAPYPIYTGGDTFRVVAGADLTVRIR